MSNADYKHGFGDATLMRVLEHQHTQHVLSREEAEDAGRIGDASEAQRQATLVAARISELQIKINLRMADERFEQGAGI